VASKNLKIENVLNDALNTWATDNSIPVAWSGQVYSRITPGKYVSQHLLPVKPQNVAIGTGVKQRYSGVYQIDVYASTENSKYDADELVESLESVFRVGYPLTYGGVSIQIENFFPDTHGLEDGWYRVSISVYYRTEI
jgi:hypothetical protein